MKKTILTLIVLAAFLIVLRLFLPSLVKWYVNKTLSQIPGYQGRVERIGVSLWRGAYQIRGLNILKTTGKVPVPYIKADLIDLSVQWKELFHGALVGEIVATRPVLNFVKGKSKDESQTGFEEASKGKEGDEYARHKEAANDWRKVVTDLFPLNINHFRIHDGSIHFRDISDHPEVDVYLDQMEVLADNLTNSRKVSKTMVANVKAHARAMRRGNLFVRLDMNPYSPQPNFDLEMALKDLNLTDLNDFIRHYAKFDVRRGSLDVFAEVAASKGYVKGDVKPLVRDIDVVNLKEEPFSLKALQKVLIEWAAALFTNKRTDAAGTKIEFAGRLDDPQSSVWTSIKYAFQNAFIRALSDRLEGGVSLKEIRNIDAIKRQLR